MKCKKKVPLTKNGNERGVCSREVNHSGHHSNETCFGCGVKLTSRNSWPSTFAQGQRKCSKCGTHESLLNRRRLGMSPLNWQVAGKEHTFPCGCSGTLPGNKTESNKFAVSKNIGDGVNGWYCRVLKIVGSIRVSATLKGYKPIDMATPHSLIRQMMQRKDCVLCGELLEWKFGPGKTPHLHHNHNTGEIYGFSHPRCNPNALENHIWKLEAEVKQLKQELVALPKAA